MALAAIKQRLRMPGLRARFAQRGREYIKRRQGSDGTKAQLHKRRIYILPTRAGVLYAGVTFMLLVGSLNYANNMGFILTFLLTGIGLVAMHHSHRNLNNLLLAFTRAEPAFAGQDAHINFVLHNNSPLHRWQINAGWEHEVAVCGDIEPDSRATLRLVLPTKQRGWIACPRIGMHTTYPLGLFRAWAWVHMDIHALVYPQPAEYVSSLHNAADDAGASGSSASGDDEFSGLREYRRGDSPRRVAWKSAASLGTLLVKEYHEGGHSPLWIDWDVVDTPDIEQRLSLLCRLLLNADNNDQVYGLRMPGTVIPPSKGHKHLHRCLRTLALFDAKVAAR